MKKYETNGQKSRAQQSVKICKWFLNCIILELLWTKLSGRISDNCASRKQVRPRDTHRNRVNKSENTCSFWIGVVWNGVALLLWASRFCGKTGLATLLERKLSVTLNSRVHDKDCLLYTTLMDLQNEFAHIMLKFYFETVQSDLKAKFALSAVWITDGPFGFIEAFTQHLTLT